MTKIKLSGIVWDTGEQADLPADMTIEVETDQPEVMFDAAVDAASDKAGWCIKSIGGNEVVS